ncbi:MAG TPA: 30S ribosomal protein S1 [Cyanobacteria bacterium UBA11149]|nr:30S ribosomal protein S1 [Cyanobacteria bacterium UBA11367]HBE57090.1 30S ribosomal protein S1 [Cyanobacteria bacterium UBA11366]HBK65922.1 30S ribosomal protein S1 [Cyanobacteria bacterium UBA11166]HBR75288.1 30S ribosomal protein S1 [Cyanobacteria bacterium UBA11159]HBS71439.1 30S ribosomal protein S1 [Cyanobacteria bacterium UBA11153]HBW88798.1 30S ribosomal protein S1 [Cyanobacteria bacterium UBA11149]HCA96934.1 30S ribosomal protein S1 [Cyanobacteria bacterium UBA9226]
MKAKKTPSPTSQPSFSMDDFVKALESQEYGFKKGQVVQGKVYNYETDGAYVDIGGKSLAYIPGNEVSANQSADWEEVMPLNQEMDFLIIREQDGDGQVTVSRRQLEIKKLWDEAAQLQESGKSFQVRVSGVNKGGVTVDYRGLRGFIPRSHLREREKLESLIGQVLTVTIIEGDRDRNKLVVSQREASRAESFSQLELGQLVEGKVASIKPFGVFVDLEGITGLLHIKQVSQSMVPSLTNVFQIGNIIKAMVINLEQGQGRVSLSTRVLENYPGEMLEKMSEVMDSADARAERARKKLLQE